MPRPGTFIAAFFVALASGACGSAGETGEEASDATTTMAEEAPQELSCWLRGATMEEAMERASPLGQTTLELNGTVGRICYGRPSARGRVVEGGLIPYGDPWRLGANEATAIHLASPARVGEVALDAGSYSLYTIAGESEWEFVLNSEAERWGIPINDQVRELDLGTFTAVPETLGEPVEQLTIRWEAQSDEAGMVWVEWGTTRVGFQVALTE